MKWIVIILILGGIMVSQAITADITPSNSTPIPAKDFYNNTQIIDTENILFEIPKHVTHYWVGEKDTGRDFYEFIVSNFSTKGYGDYILRLTWTDNRYRNITDELYVNYTFVNGVMLSNNILPYSINETATLNNLKKETGTITGYDYKLEQNTSCSRSIKESCLVNVSYPVYSWSNFNNITIPNKISFTSTDQTGISDCGTLNAGNYILQDDVWNDDTCFTINGDVILNCDSYLIEGDYVGYGIYSIGHDLEVRNCDISVFENGIYFRNGEGIIEDNTIGDILGSGIVLRDVTNSEISGNNVNSYGGSSLNFGNLFMTGNIINNTISGNTFNNYDIGINWQVSTGENNTFYNNNINNQDGTYGYGVYISFVGTSIDKYNHFTSNNFNNNDYAYRIYSSPLVDGNEFHAYFDDDDINDCNTQCILLQNTKNLNFTNGKIYNTAGAGVQIWTETLNENSYNITFENYNISSAGMQVELKSQSEGAFNTGHKFINTNYTSEKVIQGLYYANLERIWDYQAYANASGEAEVLPDDTLSYWKLEENGNDELEVNDLTVSGAVYDTGLQGYALDFDGNSDCAYQIETATTPASYPFTISAWVNNDNGANDEGEIFSISDYSDSLEVFGIQTDSSGNLALIASPTGWQSQSCGVEIDDGQWHHVAGVFFNDTHKECYLDGENIYNWTTDIPYSVGVDSIAVGCFQRSSGIADEFIGLIDETMIFNRNLSATEIKEIYDNENIFFRDAEIPVNSSLSGDDTSANNRDFASYTDNTGYSPLIKITEYINDTSDGTVYSTYTITATNSTYTNSPVTSYFGNYHGYYLDSFLFELICWTKTGNILYIPEGCVFELLKGEDYEI